MLELPRLDDRSFDELLTEARAAIPAAAPEWTDHNASDPGIALLELFAWLGEMLIYRADQVTDAHRLAFVRLMQGPEWTPGASPDVAAEVGAALRRVRERWRAVTPEDYAAIARDVAPAQIARVHCVPRRDLAGDPAADAPGAVSVVLLPALAGEVRVVGADDGDPRVIRPGEGFRLPSDETTSVWVGASSPFGGVRIALSTSGAGHTLRFQYHDGRQWRGFPADDGTGALAHGGTVAFTPPAGWAVRPDEDPPRFWIRFTTTTPATRIATARRIAPVMPLPGPALLAAVRAELEPRRILTTRVSVGGAAFVPVGAEVLVAREPGTTAAVVAAAVAARLDAFLDPLSGGPDGQGWPLGRPVYLRELEQVIAALPGVDHVPDVLATSPTATRLVHPEGDVVGLDVGANRLPDGRIDEAAIVTAITFVPVHVRLALTVAASAVESDVRAAVKAAVRRFLHPLHGGPAGQAGEWPAADLEAAVRAVAGVTQVTADLATEPSDRVIRDSAGLQVLKLRDGELADPATTIAVS